MTTKLDINGLTNDAIMSMLFGDIPSNTVIKMKPGEAPTIDIGGKIANLTENITNSFFDDDMLNYLLEDIMKEKAKQADKEIKRLAEKERRKEVDDFSNMIDHVLFNNPWTIIFWKSGQVTRVKCQAGDTYDKEKGFAIALLKGIFDNTNYFNTIFKKWVPEEDK